MDRLRTTPRTAVMGILYATPDPTMRTVAWMLTRPCAWR